VEVWAWCLLPNHVHLIAVPPAKEALTRAIGEAHRRYTKVDALLGMSQDWHDYLLQEDQDIDILRRHERTGRPLGPETAHHSSPEGQRNIFKT